MVISRARRKLAVGTVAGQQLRPETLSMGPRLNRRGVEMEEGSKIRRVAVASIAWVFAEEIGSEETATNCPKG
jgi:hypothetical protein